MTRFQQFSIAACAVFMATACVTPPSVAPAGTLQPEAEFSVDLARDWSHFPAAFNPITQGSMITQDGFILNRIHMMTLEAGEPIMKARKTDDVPRFNTGMSQIELVELVTATLNRVGYESVTAENVEPMDFDGLDGVQFQITGKFDTGLNLKGNVGLAQDGEKLHVIYFLAPELHYHETMEDEAKAIIASADVM